MPSAGLYPIHTDKITFGRDGRWYADGEPVLHPRLASFFSRHLRRKPDGNAYEIWVDERFHSDIEVEDTPFVVVSLDCSEEGAIVLELNDGTREPLSAAGLSVGPDEALYCAVKHGQERARLLRPAHNQLAGRIEQQGEKFEVHCGSQRYPIHRD